MKKKQEQERQQVAELRVKPVMRHAKTVLKVVPPHATKKHIQVHVQAHGQLTVIGVFQEAPTPILAPMAHGRPGLMSHRALLRLTHVVQLESVEPLAPARAEAIQAGQTFPRVQPLQTHVGKHEIVKP